MRRLPATAFLACAFLSQAACHGAKDQVPGDANDHSAWNGIRADETIHLIGTEPFWGGSVSGAKFTLTTVDNQAGQVITVSRFAGRGGVSFSGKLDGSDLMLAVTPADCSDGMSDTRYPFVVTFRAGDQVRDGCGWTQRQPKTQR